MPEPVKMVSNPDLWEVVQRLGGITNDTEAPLNFTYSEIVAILSRLHEEKKLVAPTRDGQYVQAAFVLQDPPSMQSVIYRRAKHRHRPPARRAAQASRRRQLDAPAPRPRRRSGDPGEVGFWRRGRQDCVAATRPIVRSAERRWIKQVELALE